MDLQRVRRLALGSSAEVLSSDYRDGVHEISSLLQLLTGVEELFLEERNLPSGDLLGTSSHPDESKLWHYSPALEVDILATDFLQHNIGYLYEDWKAYKDDNLGDGSRFFLDTARKLEERLASRRDELVLLNSLVPWKIPEISIVYIASAPTFKAFFEWRRVTWNRIQATKEDQARSEAIEAARRSIDVPRSPIYEHEGQPLSPFSQKFKDDEEFYEECLNEAIYGYDYDYSSDGSS